MPSGDSICIVTQHPLPDRLELACRQCRVQISASSVRPMSCSAGGYGEVYVRAWIRLCCFMSEIRQCSLLTLKYVYQHRQYAYYGAAQDTQAAPTVRPSGHLVHDDGWWREQQAASFLANRLAFPMQRRLCLQSRQDTQVGKCRSRWQRQCNFTLCKRPHSSQQHFHQGPRRRRLVCQ